MPNFSPLSSTVSFDDLLKANKQQFDSIFSAQTKELGLIGASVRPPTSADLASAALLAADIAEAASATCWAVGIGVETASSSSSAESFAPSDGR